MKYIVTTCAGREHLVENLKKQIPDLIVNFDDFTDTGQFTSTAWYNYQRSWKLAENEPCIQMDDDIVLCENFTNKIEAAILKYPDEIIQFFSMRKKDIEIGTRKESMSTFLMQQCYYLPKGIAAEIYKFSFEFAKYTKEKNCPTDSAMRDWGKINKKSYIIWVPNLVNHLNEVSKIDKKRSKYRQSKTFEL